jgi:simple sugar transport system permease protein
LKEKIKTKWKLKINKQFVVSLIASLLGLVAGGLLMLLAHNNPFTGFSYLFKGGTMNLERIGNSIATATPLIFTGLAAAFAFRSGLFNIGISGQMLMGGLCATVVALRLPAPRPVVLIIALLAAAVGGAVWAAIPGFLKAIFNVHEVVATIMFNWIAYWSVYYIVPSYLKDTYLETESMKISASNSLRADWLTNLFNGSFVNYGTFVAIITVIVIAFILNRTTLGFGLKAVGYNRYAAEYAGIKVNASIVEAMVFSGLLAGLAGAAYYIGNAWSMQIGVQPSQGFDGIAVALLSNNSPIGVLIAAVFFGIIYSGKGFMSANTSIPPDIADTIIAIIIYFAATSVLITRLLDWMGKYTPTLHNLFKRSSVDKKEKGGERNG